MAKLTLNSALKDIRGAIDNWVYRRFGDQMILGRRPQFSGPPSAAQLGVRDRFRDAAAYARTALADPVLQPRYRAAAEAKRLPVFAFVMGDFLNPPQVTMIDATGYHGHVGDPVKVNASDGFEVASVDVVIRHGAVLVEQGPAVFADGRWTYATTVAVPAGQTVTIEATAKDRPGHIGDLAISWLIT